MAQQFAELKPVTAGVQCDIRRDAVRRSLLELTRVAEQTAIYASFLRGHKLKHKNDGSKHKKDRSATVREFITSGYEPTARSRLARALLDALHASLGVSGVQGRMEVIDLRWRGYDEDKDTGEFTAPTGVEIDIWKDHPCWLGVADRPKEPQPDLPQLDLAVLPVDGLTALLDGMQDGSVVAIAAAQRVLSEDGSATRSKFLLETWQDTPSSFSRHLVVVARPGIDLGPKDSVIELPKAGDSWKQGVYVKRLFDHFREQFATSKELPSQLPPQIGTIDAGTPFSCVDLLKGWCQIRHLRGSSVAATISVGSPRRGLDAFVGVLRGASVALVAATAKAMGAQFRAFPLNRTNLASKGRYSLELANGDRPPLNADSFVTGDDYGLIITGVTPNPLLPGVHRQGSEVTTETVLFNAHYGSARTIHHRRDLKQDTFYGEDGQRIDALDALREFCQPQE
ncbi:MAG: fructose-bisphosphatase class II [Phycisphaerales bacterium]|nr:fructose-bisphosphatase class II [Phycisphaerales bacterium]